MGSAGLPLMLLLLVGALARIPGSEGGKETPVHFLVQGKSECHFFNGTQQVQYLQSYFYDRQEYLRFDSNLGKFKAITELGQVDADAWNKDKRILEDAMATVDRFCSQAYRLYLPHQAGSSFPQHHPPLHREGLLPHGDRGPVAEEWLAGGGGRGLWGGAPERRLDLPAPGVAGDPAPAGGPLCLPGGTRQPGGPLHRPVGAPFLQLCQDQTLDRDYRSRAGGGLPGCGALPPPEEQESNSHPTPCSTHELILCPFLFSDGKEIFGRSTWWTGERRRIVAWTFFC